MIDESELRLSEFYFTVIQVLRIADNWIQESMDDLRRMFSDMERLYVCSTVDDMELATLAPLTPDARNLAIETFKQNWNVVRSRQKEIGASLQSRIKKREEEVKSLRDGVRSR